MAVEGKTFDLQSVTAADDAQWRWNSNKVSRVTSGCVITQSGLNINISSGFAEIHGRQVKFTSTTTVEVPASAGNVYGRVFLTVDLSMTNTTTACNQCFVEVVTSSSGYPAPVQNDLDANPAGKYQMPLCRFTQGAGGITTIVDERQTNKLLKATLTVAGWVYDGSKYSQSVVVNGLTAYDTLIVTDIYHETGMTQEAWENALTGFASFIATGWWETGTNSATFYCYEAPEYAFTAQLKEV